MEDADRQKSRTFNGLTAKEWASLSRNVWDDVSSPRQKKHIDHGATFPEKLAARLITLYSRPGDLVLDPFVGTGTTLEACAATGEKRHRHRAERRILPDRTTHDRAVGG